MTVAAFALVLAVAVSTLSGPAEDDGALHTTTGAADGLEFAHGRAVVHAPIALVWKALREPAVVVDRRRIARFEVSAEVSLPRTRRFRLHQRVRAFITVEFDTEWRQDLVEGTPAEPQVVSARAEKVAGTRYIERLEDELVLRRLGPALTLVELTRRLRATQAGREEARVYIEDLFHSLVAWTRGAPLPTWR